MARNLSAFECFEQWCVSVLNLEPRTSIILSKWHKKLDRGIQEEPDKAASLLQQDIMQYAASDEARPIYIEFNVQVIVGESITLDFSENTQPVHIQADTTPHISTWLFDAVRDIKLTSAICGLLHVRGSFLHSMKLKNCRLAYLRIDSASKLRRLHLQDCWIGTLEIGANGVQQLSVEGGTIRSVKCPTPDQPNPFVGSATFHNIKFPTKRTALLDGAQGYRNLRSHLEKLQNVQMANLMRTLELKTERQDDRGTIRLVNWIYDVFGNHGLSPGRPLAFIGLFYLVASIVLVVWDGGACGVGPEEYVGWREILTRPDMEGDIYRSFLLPLQPIANPLGVFWPRSLVIAGTVGGKALLVAQGTATYVLLAMFIFGIRKRFKLH